MILKDSLDVREKLADKGFVTIEEIAEATKMSNRTIGRLLLGQSVRFGTIQKLAKFLDCKPSDIAEVKSTLAQ